MHPRNKNKDLEKGEGCPCSDLVGWLLKVRDGVDSDMVPFQQSRSDLMDIEAFWVFLLLGSVVVCKLLTLLTFKTGLRLPFFTGKAVNQ